jgi:hypothetical protein
MMWMHTRRIRAGGAVVFVLGAAVPLTAEDRSYDGSGNNPVNPTWGMAGTRLRQPTTPEYGDGFASPAGQNRPGPREVSNIIGAQSASTMNDAGLSDLHTFWGQFLDHDLDLTPGGTGESFPIPIPTGDPWFDPQWTGEAALPFERSLFDEKTGTPGVPRQQINVLTSYIDASMVYGSDAERATALRTLDGTGRLKTGPGDVLPYNTFGLSMANPLGLPDEEIFAAGDVRANENCRLMAFHTLFVREHNRLCDQLAALHPDWSDEQIYQRARRFVGAYLQSITYNEYLPALLGPDAIPPYQGYDVTVNAAISSIFSTAGFRFGHSQLNEIMARIGNDDQVVPEGNVNLRDTFFAPDVFLEVETGVWLKGGAWLTAQNIDIFVVSSVRNFLFGPPGSGGLDLFSLNLQRGRDHGLADYNQARLDFGLLPVSSFAQISSDPAVQQALTEAYGNPGDIDPWIGGLAENDVPGAMVGPLVHAILVDQFTRLRDGDRFWFENDDEFTAEEVAEIHATRLAGIIVRNTSIKRIQTEVFYAPGPNVPIFADLNMDGLVNVVDLVLLIQAWGPVSQHIELAVADVNGDAQVDSLDLVELILSWSLAS